MLQWMFPFFKLYVGLIFNKLNKYFVIKTNKQDKDKFIIIYFLKLDQTQNQGFLHTSLTRMTAGTFVTIMLLLEKKKSLMFFFLKCFLLRSACILNKHSKYTYMHNCLKLNTKLIWIDMKERETSYNLSAVLSSSHSLVLPSSGLYSKSMICSDD